jgi:hypothetical protein
MRIFRCEAAGFATAGWILTADEADNDKREQRQKVGFHDPGNHGLAAEASCNQFSIFDFGKECIRNWKHRT